MATLGGTGPAGGGRAAVTDDEDEVVISVCYQLEGGRRPGSVRDQMSFF